MLVVESYKPRRTEVVKIAASFGVTKESEIFVPIVQLLGNIRNDIVSAAK